MARKWITILRPKFIVIFQENHKALVKGSIFAGSKTLQKVMKITHFDVLQGPFVDGDQASRRVYKIVQNYVKMHLKSPQNDHEKSWISILQWSKTHAVAWRVKMHQNALMFCVPGVALLTQWMKNRSKSPKIHHKITTNTKLALVMVKNARRRPTCEKT